MGCNVHLLFFSYMHTNTHTHLSTLSGISSHVAEKYEAIARGIKILWSVATEPG